MTELSPAAQAIKNAALAEYADCNVRKLAWPLDMPVVAAALRAAADQVVPIDYVDIQGCWYEKKNSVREQFLAIATELEDHQ